mmetsp:Transcript_222/g.621  ORF Transcript_222/g.621 Transcript_222/m.621 type:complete len:311 (+) Transcript_222:2719-3651(+)
MRKPRGPYHAAAGPSVSHGSGVSPTSSTASYPAAPSHPGRPEAEMRKCLACAALGSAGARAAQLTQGSLTALAISTSGLSPLRPEETSWTVKLGPSRPACFLQAPLQVATRSTSAPAFEARQAKRAEPPWNSQAVTVPGVSSSAGGTSETTTMSKGAPVRPSGDATTIIGMSVPFCHEVCSPISWTGGMPASIGKAALTTPDSRSQDALEYEFSLTLTSTPAPKPNLSCGASLLMLPASLLLAASLLLPASLPLPASLLLPALPSSSSSTLDPSAGATPGPLLRLATATRRSPPPGPAAKQRRWSVRRPQ